MRKLEASNRRNQSTLEIDGKFETIRDTTYFAKTCQNSWKLELVGKLTSSEKWLWFHFVQSPIRVERGNDAPFWSRLDTRASWSITARPYLICLLCEDRAKQRWPNRSNKSWNFFNRAVSSPGFEGLSESSRRKGVRCFAPSSRYSDNASFSSSPPSSSYLRRNFTFIVSSSTTVSSACTVACALSFSLADLFYLSRDFIALTLSHRDMCNVQNLNL